MAEQHDNAAFPGAIIPCIGVGYALSKPDMEKAVESGKEEAQAQRDARLKKLEYAIRTSITVREDQEEDADPRQLQEASDCGIAVDTAMSKGDLLNAVQTAVRASARSSP